MLMFSLTPDEGRNAVFFLSVTRWGKTGPKTKSYDFFFSTRSQQPEVWARGFTDDSPLDRKSKNKWTNYSHLQLFTSDCGRRSSRWGPLQSVRWGLKEACYFTQTHKEVNFTMSCQNKLRRSLTIWERLLGQPLISSIFSLAEERRGGNRQTKEEIVKTLFRRVRLM